MPMRISRIADGELFAPVGHRDVQPIRLQGGSRTPTDALNVVLSHYAPGGVAELASQQIETVYVVTVGRLVFESDGRSTTCGPMDSVHLTVGTARTVRNDTDEPASMLVIRPAR